MSVSSFFFFFFNDTATTEIYTFPYTTLFRSCSLSPRYQRPSVPTPPPSYKEAGEWKVAAPADSTSRGRWWTMFNDQALDDLETQVSEANQSLRAALARLEQARAETRSVHAGSFPTLTAEASATRQRTSLNAPTYAPGRPTTGNVLDRKSTRLNSSHSQISYAVFC